MTDKTGNLAAALDPLVSRVRTDVTATKGRDGRSIWTRDELTPLRIRRHLDLTDTGQPRGVCPIKAGESTTRVALFDLDSHKGATPWPEMAEVAERLIDEAELLGVSLVPFRSSGGRGIHLYAVWDEPQDAYSVRQHMALILASAGFKSGTKGVAQGEIEVFPKQDEVSAEGFGNQFILPLCGKSVPLDALGGLSPLPREAALDLGWAASDPVPKRERPVRETPVAPRFEGGAELDQLRSALAAIDNGGDGLGYDEWRDIVSGVHHATGGSEDGYALAFEFSARSAKFEEEELRVKVWDWLSGKGGRVDSPVTEATVFKHARDAGWNDVTPESFDVVVSRDPEDVHVDEGHDLKADLPSPRFQRDKNGAIEAIVNNVQAAVWRIDFCGKEIAYDRFRDELVFCERGFPRQWQPFYDHHYTELRMELERRGFKPIGRELIRDVVGYVAQMRAIDTAIVWLSSLHWDGKPRIERFLPTYFGTDDNPYTRAVSLYWWTAMAGRVLSPGCQADMAPILVSPQQGLRKSSAVAAMVPEHAARVMNFGQSEDARSRLLRGALSVELAELHGLKTRAKEEIRAWMTKRFEEWVPKFKEFAIKVPRRCIFVGTSNPTDLFEEFERRWLPVMIGDKIDIEGIERDRELMWAEAAVRWSRDGVAWQEAEALVREVQVDFRVVDTWEESLARWAQEASVDTLAPAVDGFTTREALVECLGFSDRTIKRADEMRCSSALKNIGFENKLGRRGGRVGRYWVPS